MTDSTSEPHGSLPHHSEEPRKIPNASETVGSIPQPSEIFGKVPNPSEESRSVPQSSETFRTVRNVTERTENHTLTVREVARMFEEAGVPRTERSIINWCQVNRQGVARLDAFLDENEGRYYITPQSVTRAIEEERAKQPPSEPAPTSEKTIPQPSETLPRHAGSDGTGVKELERQNRDLEIVSRAKDFYIERLEGERESFHDQLLGMSRYVGELETQLLQLGGAPRGALPKRSESGGSVPHDAGNESSR